MNERSAGPRRPRDGSRAARAAVAATLFLALPGIGAVADPPAGPAVADPSAGPAIAAQAPGRPLVDGPAEIPSADRLTALEARRTEMAEKLDRLRGLMESRGLAAVLIRSVHNFQWLTAGGDSHIVLAERPGVATLVVRADGRRFVVTSNSEAARLLDEDLAGLGFELREYEWHAGLAADAERRIVEELVETSRRDDTDAPAAVSGVGSDLPFPGGVVIEDELRALRAGLTDNEISKYRWIGSRAAAAVDEVARAVRPGMSERDIEAMTADALMRRGLTPTVLLIGVDERVFEYRHATPTDRPLRRYAMINLTARRWGLVVAITRFVHFGPLPERLAERLRAVAVVDAAYLAATRPGATADEVLAAGQRAYADAGWPEEWRRHHQGGAIGYLEREWVAYPGSPERVQARQAFAWNPTIEGTKVEDTILALEGHNEVLTRIDGWPRLEVAVGDLMYERPGILVREMPSEAGAEDPLREAPEEPGVVARFPVEPDPLALTGPARPGRYLEASGRRAAFLGDEAGRFEAWVWPLKVLRDFELRFGIDEYAEPLPAEALATRVEARPETATVRYSHAAFTVDATWLVPLHEPGGVVLLDVDASEPVTVEVRFRPELVPMWPAGLGGQYSYWDEELRAWVIGEGSGRHAALIGSPLGLRPPPSPAHNLPDAPNRFRIEIDPATAAAGLVPIAVAASTDGFEAARATYRKLLGDPAPFYREAAAHYRRLRDEMTSVDTPDDRLDLALEWGKVALDKGFVCNPQLGCGLVAGLGPSGTSYRPGFGWFFGGDAFINSWAMTAYGDFETVRRTLEFLRERQRDDGKMMHELSQGAAYIRWFEDYPYGYYHADTTPLYLVAVRDYVVASGDLEFARQTWPSILRAYEYCAGTDEDGDGLMDNTRAGLAAVETGSLRSRDVLTDVYLAAAWTEATAATADLAGLLGEPLERQAAADHRRARESLNRRFLDDDGRRIHFAVMRDGSGQAEDTVWPAFGLWRGVFDPGRPAVEGTLERLAGSGLGADWGARMLSRRSALYEPLSYNNGAVWPFLSGFATLALYEHGRGDAAWRYLQGTAELTALGDRGWIPELLSGDRLQAIDAAVPHQLFATTGLVSGLLRGLVGLKLGSLRGIDAPEKVAGSAARSPRLTLAPQLPAGWDRLAVRKLRWRDAVVDLQLRRRPDRTEVRISAALAGDGAPADVPLDLILTFPPGAEDFQVTGPGLLAGPPQRLESTRHAHPRLLISLATRDGSATVVVDHAPGIELRPQPRRLRTGDRSRRLRILGEALEAGSYRVRLEGRRDLAYGLELDVPFEIRDVRGARQTGRDGTTIRLEVSFDDRPGNEDGPDSDDGPRKQAGRATASQGGASSDDAWTVREVVVELGPRSPGR